MVGALVFCAFPQELKAEEFTGKSFLAWERENQDFYIKTAIGMAGLIVSRNDQEQSKCIEAWYLPDENAKHDFILKTMREHLDFHPRGIILAVLEKQCGSFIYTARASE